MTELHAEARIAALDHVSDASPERAERLTFAVPLWRCNETLRDLERTALRFGLRRRALQARWRGLHVDVRIEVEGSLGRLHAFERAVSALCMQ